MIEGYFSGDWSLHESGEPDTFLLIPSAMAFAFTRPNGEVITIDRPFVTDGASIPRFVRLFKWLDPYGTFRRAAFIHDFLWILRYTNEQFTSFWKSNIILYEGCRVCGLWTWQACIVWFVVTTCGWPSWIIGKWQRKRAARKVNVARRALIRKGISWPIVRR